MFTHDHRHIQEQTPSIGKSTLVVPGRNAQPEHDASAAGGGSIDVTRLRQEIARVEALIPQVIDAVGRVDVSAAGSAAAELRMVIATIERRLDMAGGPAEIRRQATHAITKARAALINAPEPSAASTREALDGVSNDIWNAEQDAWRAARMRLDPVDRQDALDQAHGQVVPLTEKRADATAPIGDHKHAVRFDAEWPIPLPPEVGKGVFKIRWEMSVTRKGNTSYKRGQDQIKVGEAQNNYEVKLKGKQQEVSQKISASLAKLGAGLLDSGKQDVLGVPMTLALEAKFLDAEVSSLEGLALHAMKVAIVGEGDFTGAFTQGDREFADDSAFKAKAQIRVEVAIPAQMAMDLYHLAQASKELKRAAAIEERLNAAKRKRAHSQKLLRKLEERGRSNLGAKDLQRLDELQAEVKDLGNKVDDLQELRAGSVKTRDASIAKIKNVGKRLQNTKLGRAMAGLAGKALGATLKRFIPIYNLVQNAKDVYEVAEFLANARWSNLFDGKSGDTLNGNGADGPEGTGGTNEQGDGTEDLTTTGLEPRTTVQLTPAAEEVVRLVGRSPGGAGQALDDDAKEIINRVVPDNLSKYEMDKLSRMLASRGTGQSIPLAQAIIAAMQAIRPDGARREGPMPGEQQPPQSPQPQVPPPQARSQRPQQESRVVDLIGYLTKNVSIESGRLVAPTRFEIAGAVFEITHRNAGFDIAMDKYQVVLYVTVVDKGSRELILTTKERVKEGLSVVVRFSMAAPMTVRSR